MDLQPSPQLLLVRTALQGHSANGHVPQGNKLWHVHQTAESLRQLPPPFPLSSHPPAMPTVQEDCIPKLSS